MFVEEVLLECKDSENILQGEMKSEAKKLHKFFTL